MQDSLKITLIQSNLIWENPLQNRLNLSKQIASISEETNLIIFPEMFNSGFTMDPDRVAEPMKGETVNWMKEIAHSKQAAVYGSLVIEENQNYFNRGIFVSPNGDLEHYDKRHTFTLAGEHKVYGRGNEKVIVDHLGWKICLQICYDLRFPVWARNVEDYDLLIYVANWPKARIEAWDTLLKARAIENMCYCVGVNRVGLDGNNFEYTGHSALYDGLGKRLSNIPESKEYTSTHQLDKSHLRMIREKLKFLADRDSFNLEV